MHEEGVQPDNVTFVGLLSEPVAMQVWWTKGLHCDASMSTVYMISTKLEHYSSMVELLGCALQLFLQSSFLSFVIQPSPGDPNSHQLHTYMFDRRTYMTCIIFRLLFKNLFSNTFPLLPITMNSASCQAPSKAQPHFLYPISISYIHFNFQF